MSKNNTQKFISALKRALGLSSRVERIIKKSCAISPNVHRSIQTIAGLVGQELTIDEMRAAMTDTEQVPLAKTYDWYFSRDGDDRIVLIGADEYGIQLNFRRLEEKVSPGEIVTATFTLKFDNLPEDWEDCDKIKYKIGWFKVDYIIKQSLHIN
ncbi:MAG: hypothetical protein J6R26_08515 [Paludibacteraceae bacterium]|nr:hypothetical protein [Paludibacteraceae bacterium]